MKNINIIDAIQYSAAIEEIKDFIIMSAGACKARGYGYVLTNDAPESFKALKKSVEIKDNGRLVIPIADYGSDTSIYEDAHLNAMFRFYHDVTHLELDKGFTKQGEYSVIDQHLQDFIETNPSRLALAIFEADTYGQVDYYERHKQFINDQKAFVMDCLQYGRKYALTRKYY